MGGRPFTFRVPFTASLSYLLKFLAAAAVCAADGFAGFCVVELSELVSGGGGVYLPGLILFIHEEKAIAAIISTIIPIRLFRIVNLSSESLALDSCQEDDRRTVSSSISYVYFLLVRPRIIYHKSTHG